MKVQSEAQLIDAGVQDPSGQLVGRVAAVVCGPDPYTARWLVVRLKWRRAWRAVPATSAVWKAGAGVRVPYPRQSITGSPALSAGELAVDTRRVDAYYAALTGWPA